MSHFLMVTAMLATATPSLAAPVGASLKEFIDAADQQNLDRRISAEQRLVAAAQFTQAWTALLPALTAQAGWTHNQYAAILNLPTSATTSQQVVIVPLDQLDALFRVDLPLVDTARWFRTMAADAQNDAAEQRELATREQVKRQVVGTYYSLAAAKALVQSAQKSLAVAQAQLDLQKTRVRAGTVTELDQMRAQAEVERSRQIIADTTALVATTARSLRTLSGLEPAAEIAGLPQDALEAEPALDQLESKAETLPALKAAEADLAAAGNLTSLQKFTLIPNIGANFTERFTNATGFTGRFASYTFGVNLTWRLDGLSIVAPRVAEAQENVARLAIERSRLAARDQVHSDWQRIAAAITKVQATGTQVQAAQRASLLAKDRYEAGVATQIDVIQGERDVFSAEVSQIQAKTELASARASLRISTGQPVLAE